MAARVQNTAAECMGCRRRVPVDTMIHIPYLGTFCPPCGIDKQQEIEARR